MGVSLAVMFLLGAALALVNPSSSAAASSGDRSEKTVANSDSSDSDSSAKPNTPKFNTVGQIENYIEVSWHPISNATGVNVYRNNEYIGSVNFPNHIMNDFKGKPGDSYTS